MFRDILKWLMQQYEMIRRMVFWGWKLRNSWDFDAQTIYTIMYLKLDRLYNCFRDNGHCVWNSSERNSRMRQLSECRELFRRLDEYDPMMVAYDEVFGLEYVPHGKRFKHQELLYQRRLNHHTKIRAYMKHRAFHLLEKNIDIWWD